MYLEGLMEGDWMSMDGVDFQVKGQEGELVYERALPPIDEKAVEAYTRMVSDQLVGELIAIRKSRKLTQQDVADAVGMPRGNISRIERKLYTPTLGVLMKYADCLGLKIDLSLAEKTE